MRKALQFRARWALVCSLLVATCAVPVPGNAADAFEINAILPLTGSGAFLGQEEVTALHVFENLINKGGGIRGRQIKFNVLDDQSSPQVGVVLMNQLAAKGAQVVLGSTLTAICSAQAAVAKDGPVIYCLSPGVHPPAGSYLFSAGVSTADELAASVRFMREHGWTKIAALTSTDATGQDADTNIASALKNSGVQLVAQEHFAITDLSVSAQIARIKASGAQLLIVWSTGTPATTVLRGVYEAGLNLPILAAPSNLTYTQMKAYASFMPREIYFPGTDAFAPEVLPKGTELLQAVTRYRDAFKNAGIRPGEGILITWEPAQIVTEAYRKLGFDATAAQIRQFISQYREVGIDGRFNFDAIPQRGVGIDAIVLLRWDPAKDNWIGASRPGGGHL